MGKSLEHLRGLEPGKSHHLQSGGYGEGSRMTPPAPVSKQSKGVPHFPDGESRARGARTEAGGAKANIAPSMKPDGMGPCLTK